MINENPTPRSTEGDTSVVGLVKQLVHEVPALFTKELALAKAELGESLRTTKAGVAGVAAGAIVLLAGFIVLLMGIVYFLSQYLTQKAVGQFDLGPAAAFSLIYFLIILLLCFILYNWMQSVGTQDKSEVAHG